MLDLDHLAENLELGQVSELRDLYKDAIERRLEQKRLTREAYWTEYGAFRITPVYEAKLLKHGNSINGEAIIEAEDTTIVLAPGYRLSVDKYLNFIIEKGE